MRVLMMALLVLVSTVAFGMECEDRDSLTYNTKYDSEVVQRLQEGTISATLRARCRKYAESFKVVVLDENEAIVAELQAVLKNQKHLSWGEFWETSTDEEIVQFGFGNREQALEKYDSIYPAATSNRDEMTYLEFEVQ